MTSTLSRLGGRNPGNETPAPHPLLQIRHPDDVTAPDTEHKPANCAVPEEQRLFGAWLKEAREVHGSFPVTMIAIRFDRSVNSVKAWEDGESLPRDIGLKVARHYETRFKRPPGYLVQLYCRAVLARRHKRGFSDVDEITNEERGAFKNQDLDAYWQELNESRIRRHVKPLPLASLGAPASDQVIDARDPSHSRDSDGSPDAIEGRPAVAVDVRGRSSSPFRPGTPLYVGDFLPGASRRTLVDTIEADLRGGANVNLIGERRMGRTSILNHLWGRFVARGDQVVARVNLQDGVAVAEEFYGAVLWGIAQSPAGAELLGCDRTAQLDHAPVATYAELRYALRRLRAQATAIVLVDEFERCFESPAGFELPVFYDSLRSLLGGDGQGAYARAVIATREPLAAYFTSRQITSTLPGYLPPRSLRLLSDAEAQEVLAQQSPFRLGSDQREHAAALAQQHPCHLQCAGEAWYRALRAGLGRDWAATEYRRLSGQVCIGAITGVQPG